jgi:hypothetical protein
LKTSNLEPGTDLVEDENSDLLEDSHSIKHYICKSLNVHGFNDVREHEIYTTEPLLPEPSSLEVDIYTGKLKSYKSSGIYQIPAELIQEGSKTLRSGINKFISSVWNKEEFSQ